MILDLDATFLQALESLKPSKRDSSRMKVGRLKGNEETRDRQTDLRRHAMRQKLVWFGIVQESNGTFQALQMIQTKDSILFPIRYFSAGQLRSLIDKLCCNKLYVCANQFLCVDQALHSSNKAKFAGDLIFNIYFKFPSSWFLYFFFEDGLIQNLLCMAWSNVG